jgi:aerobic carbon-monoxide dehydrogenase medium subunit
LLRRFALDEPETVGEASSLLSQYGENAKILAGGTELLLAMKQGVLRYDHLVNIKKITGLDRLDFDEKARLLKMGTLVTHRTLETSGLIKKKFPLIVEMERQIANIRVRTQGTIGGNLCWADPRSDVLILLLALGAQVKAVGPEGERIVPLEEFILGYYETVLKGEEMLTEIQIPALPTNSTGAYLRFTRGERPIVGIAVVLTLESKNEGIRNAVISLGCDNPPVRVREAEEYLRGKSMEECLNGLKRVGEIAAKDLDVKDDYHASGWYKKEMVQVMVGRAIHKALKNNK